MTQATLALTDSAVAQLRRELSDASDERLLRAVHRLWEGLPLDTIEQRGAVETLRQVGIVEIQSDRLTDVGWLVADSVREYLWWIERGRQLPAEGQHPGLSLANYAHKHLLEVGSGFGCNLLSMSQTPGRFVGLEPVAVYRQLTGLLAEREGLPPPQVVAGSAEQMPFDDAQFDVVTCISAHQYMDVKVALREMARVLRPGGQLQLVSGALSLRLVRHLLRQKFHFGQIKRDLLSLINTWSYQLAGRRLHVPASAGSTAAPIYPTEPFMRRCLVEVGLRLREDWTGPFDSEFCFFAERPGA